MRSETMKTIMVTGGRGMLGHAVEQVVGEEPRAGYRFEFVDIEEGDLTEKAATRALFERVRTSPRAWRCSRTTC